MNKLLKKIFYMFSGIIIVIIILITAIILYITIKNSIFLDPPTYLNPYFDRGPEISAGPGDMDPIIDSLTYYYSCKGSSLRIIQLRKSSRAYSSRSNALTLTSSKPSFLRPSQGAIEGFELIDSQEIVRDNAVFYYKKFYILKIPGSLFELIWHKSKIGIVIQTTDTCIPENDVIDEMIKLAESMK